MDKPTTETATVGNVDVEALSHNIARLIEEGGKALAAYLKPREEGKIKGDTAEDITDVVKSVGRVAEYWLSDPPPRARGPDQPGSRLSRAVGQRGQAYGGRAG